MFPQLARLSPPLHAANEDPPISYTSLKGSGQGCPVLRASDEHILIVKEKQRGRESVFVAVRAENLSRPPNFLAA